MKKHEFTVENQDPQITARVQQVMTKLLDQQLDEIELLAANPIPDHSKVDPRSSNAGKNYLDNRKGYENAMAARKRHIREAVSVVEQIRSLLVLPKPKVNPAEDPEAEKRRELLAMIKDIQRAPDTDDDDQA